MSVGIIEFVFTHEQEIRQAIVESKLDKGGRTGGNGSGHMQVSDPTASEAIRRASEVAFVSIEYMNGGFKDTRIVKKPEKWLKVIEWTRNDRPQLEIQAFELMAKNTQTSDAMEILNVSRAYYYALAENARTYAAGLAKGIGIINSYEKKVGKKTIIKDF